MVHPLPKNLYSLRLVSTLAITTHPRCCEDCARLVADKVANGKEPKEAQRPAPHIIAITTWRSPAGLHGFFWQAPALWGNEKAWSRRLVTIVSHEFRCRHTYCTPLTRTLKLSIGLELRSA